MRTLFIILTFIILLNCLKKNNNLEGLETNQYKGIYDSKCKNLNDDCGKYCNKDNYVIKEDEIDIDDNTKCLIQNSIIDKVNGVLEKIKNCDLCMYCKLLKNKIELENANQNDNSDQEDDTQNKD